VLAFIGTGFLSSAYRRARENQGHRHYALGEALASAGNVEAAAEEYRKALLFLPDEPDYRLSLSIALIELGKTDEAESYLQQLLEEDPTNGVVNLMLARVAERRKKPTQAIEYFQRAVYGYWPRGKFAARHAARWELVWLLEKQNRRNEVVGELMQLYANAAGDPKEKSDIGFLLLKYGATSDAINVFRDLVRDSPKYVEAYYGLGQAYLESADYFGARREFQRAAHLDPKDHDNLQQLSLVNAIIDLDPMLPGLGSVERVRKTRALLTRVLDDLAACAAAGPPTDPLKQNLDNAKKLLASKYSDADTFAAQLQDTSVQLWKNRASYCGKDPVRDEAVETVFARMTQ
jgi:tetratricopeptide (TPR) repeat protein